MAVLFRLPFDPFLLTGGLLAFGSVTFYQTGTLLLDTVYTDNAQTIPATNPAPLDSVGQLQQGKIFLGSRDYRVVVKNAAGTVVPNGDVDPIHGGQDAAVITYTRSPATGAVQRTLRSRLMDTLSVKDYGATGDGVTDDYAALAAAFTDALATSQRAVKVPAGTYMLSQTLNVSNVSLIGEGAIATTFKPRATFSGSSVLLIDDTTGASSGVDSLYQNFRIYGNRSALSATVHGLKLFGQVIYNQFSNIRINEVKGIGILLDGKAGPVRPSVATFINCHVSGADNDGIKIAAGRNLDFFDCAFEGLGGRGIWVTGATEQASRIAFHRPWIEQVTGDGILIEQADQITTIDPEIGGYGSTGVASYGYRVSGGNSRRNRLVGGDFAKNASPNAGSLHIFIDGGDRHILEDINVATTDLTISGNRAVIIRGNLQVGAASLVQVPFTNGRATIAGGATSYLAPYTGAQSATQTAIRGIASGYMSLSQLRMESTVNAGGTDTYTVTVMLNGVATLLSGVTAAGGGVTSDLVNEVLLSPGDNWSLRVVATATATTIPIDGLHVTVGMRM